MTLIKRYANRKLYDTEAKRYVTLDGIADLIRRGQAVRVVDHATGDDITAQIQAQIIFEEEKKSGGLLPQTLFTDLIQTGSQKLNQLRQALGPNHLHPDIDAEIERRLTTLVERGAFSEAESRRLLDLLLTAGQPEPTFTDAEIERLIRERGLPSRKELNRIARQVQALQAEIEKLRRSRSKLK